jgi:hypothetical protein
MAIREKHGDDNGARGDDGRAGIAATRAEVVDILAGADQHEQVGECS